MNLGIVFTDNGTMASAEYSFDGGQTWANFPYFPQFNFLGTATISGDGVHEVLYRATDTGGNVSEVGSVTCASTAPTPRSP